MLTLTRLPRNGYREAKASIYLTLPDGQRITVTVISVHGDRVKIGVSAPEDIRIERADLRELPQD